MIASRSCVVVLALAMSCAPSQPARESALPTTPRTKPQHQPPPPKKPSDSHQEIAQQSAPLPQAEPAQTIDEARAKIDLAHEKLKGAAQEIKKKDPAEAELKTAEESLAAVRAALDAGSTFETKDLAYAKYSLTVRKDIRAQGDFIRERRVEVGVELAQMEIKTLAAQMNDAWRRTLGKNPSDDDFTTARATAEQLTQALDRGAPLRSKNAKYATYVAGVKERLLAQKREVDKREVEVAVERRRAAIEEGRKELANALAKLNARDVAEETFVAAEETIKQLHKTIEDGAGLNKKDREYGSYVYQVSLRIKESAQKIENRRLEVAIARKKQEIETARADLNAAVRRIQSASAADDDFKEARTALDVVAKSFDGHEVSSAKDRTFSAWIADAKKTLEASRAGIDRRDLEVQIQKQRTALKAALDAAKDATHRMPELEDCDRAATVVDALDRAIAGGELYVAKDNSYAKYAAEVKKSAQVVRGDVQERRMEIATEAQRIKIEAQLEALRDAIAALDGPFPGSSELKAASDRLEATNKLLAEGAELEKSLPRYAVYAVRARKIADETAQKVERRRIEIGVRDQKASLAEVLGAAKANVETAQRSDATLEDVGRAESAIVVARDALGKGAELEKIDRAYLDFASNTRSQLERFRDQVEGARHMITFRTGPMTALATGMTLAKAARGTAEEQKKTLLAAIEQFKKCQKDAATIIVDYPRLASMELIIEKKKTLVKEVLAICAESSKGVQGQMSGVDARLAFESTGDALASARTRLARGQKKEALAALESCVENGRILQYKNTELAAEELNVGGERMTLKTIVAACHKEAKELRAKLGDSQI
jgi:hypothetical protein